MDHQATFFEPLHPHWPPRKTRSRYLHALHKKKWMRFLLKNCSFPEKHLVSNSCWEQTDSPGQKMEGLHPSDHIYDGIIFFFFFKALKERKKNMTGSLFRASQHAVRYLIFQVNIDSAAAPSLNRKGPVDIHWMCLGSGCFQNTCKPPQVVPSIMASC